MSSLPKPQLPLRIDFGGVHAKIAAEPCFRGDEVEPSEDVDGKGKRFGDPGDFAAQSAEDTTNLAVLLALEHGALSTEIGDASRLDEQRFARAAGAVDNSLQLVPVIDG